MKRAMAAVLLVLLSLLVHSNAEEEAFDVRQHLSTVSRYGVVKGIADSSFVPSKIPNGCTPIHLNLVARHGTRSPSDKRIKELDKLATHLKELLGEAEEQNQSLEKLPGWLKDRKSLWEGKRKGGQLLIEGEDELYALGNRTRARFPDLFNVDYHPDVFVINATQVPRASASAVAFGMGLFSGNGRLGPGRHRAFAVTSESHTSDTKLRFHECCQNYKDSKERRKDDVDKLKEPVYDEITSALRRRYRLNFTRQDTTSLWFLCKQEASLLNIVDQACALFSPTNVYLLEWTDDLEAFMLKGYNKSINYRMGVLLLKDVNQSMEQAIKAEKEKLAPGSYEKARLRFAHAETLIPFSCLLGLFLDGSEFEKIKRGQDLPPPPKPPHKRNWRVNTVAPFGGNNMLVLYSCPAANTSNKHFVQVLHNEHPIPMPGCDGTDFCPLDVFKKRIVDPHLKHDYNSVCDVKLEQQEQKPVASKLQQEQKPVASKLSQLIRWMFPLGNGDKSSLDEF